MSLLNDIFTTCNWARKKECSPPPGLEPVMRFSEKTAVLALRKIGNLAGETSSIERTLWLWDQGPTRWLAITEAPKARNKGTKANG